MNQPLSLLYKLSLRAWPQCGANLSGVASRITASRPKSPPPMALNRVSIPTSPVPIPDPMMMHTSQHRPVLKFLVDYICTNCCLRIVPLLTFSPLLSKSVLMLYFIWTGRAQLQLQRATSLPNTCPMPQHNADVLQSTLEPRRLSSGASERVD